MCIRDRRFPAGDYRDCQVDVWGRKLEQDAGVGRGVVFCLPWECATGVAESSAECGVVWAAVVAASGRAVLPAVSTRRMGAFKTKPDATSDGLRGRGAADADLLVVSASG